MSGKPTTDGQGPQAGPGPGDAAWRHRFCFGIGHEWRRDVHGRCGLFVESVVARIAVADWQSLGNAP